MNGFVLNVSRSLYAMLLHAYPASFRAEFQAEMVLFFEDHSRDVWRRAGWRGLIGLWERTLPDVAFTAIKERLLQAGYKGANTMDTTEFNQQFTSTLALFSRALRGGYSVAQCFEIIAKHAPEPTRSLFVKLLNDAEATGSLLSALDQTSQNVGSPYFQRTIEIMAQQRETGGNLADYLDDYNRTIYSEVGDHGWAQSVDLDDGNDQV